MRNNHTEVNTDESINSQCSVDQPEQFEWMDAIRPHISYDESVIECTFDDGGLDYDWTVSSYQYPNDFGAKWIENLKSNNETLEIPNVDINKLNKVQKLVFDLVTKTFTSNDSSNLRLIFGGKAGSGKSFLIKCLVKQIRSHFQTNQCVQVICPTGNSVNIISGITLQFLENTHP